MMKMIGVDISVTLEQEADCCSNNETQYITITSKDGGGGPYFVISTEEWAVDNFTELVKVCTTISTQIAAWNEKEATQ